MIDGFDVLLMLTVIALAFFAQYALRRHEREEGEVLDRSGDFLWLLDRDLDRFRDVRTAYDEEVLRRASARRFRELIGECDEAS